MTKEEMMMRNKMLAYNRALIDVEEHLEDYVDSIWNDKFIIAESLIIKMREILHELSYTEEDMEGLNEQINRIRAAT